MSRDSNGDYTLPEVINPVVPGTIIETTWANPTLDDVATALTDSLSRSGQGGMEADLAMQGFKVSTVGAATAVGDAPTAAQVRNSAFSWLFPVSSDATGNVYTGTAVLPAAPVDGTVFYFLADKTNTGPVTLNVNAGGAVAIQRNGAALGAGVIVTGTVVSVAYAGTTYRLIGGAAVTGALNTVVCSDTAVLGAALAGGILVLAPHTNIANAGVKLDANAKVPLAQLPNGGLAYVGQWDAGPGSNPSDGTVAGQFYVISDAGNLTIFRTSVAPAYTAQVTAVVEGDQILWNDVDTADQPTGWYFVPITTSSVAAANVSNDATPSFPGLITVQDWMDAVDPFYMPKTGGTFTGAPIYAAVPAGATVLANKQYVDDTVASGSPVVSFNTRTGAIVLISADVTDAIGYVPVNLGGDTMTGDLAFDDNAASGLKTVTFDAQVVDAQTSGANLTYNWNTGQKKKVTLIAAVTGTTTFSFPGVGHYQLVLVSGAFAFAFPAIGASFQWLNAVGAPTLNTGTYGGVVNMFFDGVMTIATYSKIGAV